MFFGKKVSPTIGLDINSSTISILQLEKTKTDLKVNRFASMLTPPGTVKEGLLADTEVVGLAVAELIESMGLGGKGPAPTANICVPGQLAVIRLMPVPMDMPNEELGDVVRQEAINNLPFPIEDANLDWVRIPGTVRTDADGVEREDILLGAVQSVIVDDYWRMAKHAGIIIGKLEISSLAAVRALAFSGQLGKETAHNLVVNIRQDATDITLVNQAAPLFSRSVLLGVETILESIQRSINADPEEAKELLARIQLLGVPTEDLRLGQAAQAARTVCADLIAEVGRSLEFYVSQTGMVSVDKVIVCGPGTAIPEIDQFLANRLNLNSIVANPFQGVVYDTAQIVDDMRPHHTTLMGLLVQPESIPTGTASLDLNQGNTLKDDDDGADAADVDTPWFVPALIAGAVILLLTSAAWAYFQFMVFPSKETELASLTKSITDNKSKVETFKKGTAVLEELEAKKKSLDSIVNHGTPITFILKALKESVPLGVTIANVRVQGLNTILQGNAIDFAKVADFTINLQGSNVFAKTDLPSVKRIYDSPETITYEIDAIVSPDISNKSLAPTELAAKVGDTVGDVVAASGPRVLNFYSAKLLACQRMKPILEQAGQKYAGKFQFQTVDVDDQANAELLKKYDIKVAPVLVFLDAKGNLSEKIQGFEGKGEAVFAACDKLEQIASKSASK